MRLTRDQTKIGQHLEELQKKTDMAVADWKEKHPRVKGGEAAPASQAENDEEEEAFSLTAEESAVIELLRVPNLSIRHLDPETKGRVREAMYDLHWKRRFSLNDIAYIIGNKTSGYSSWLFERLEVKAKPFKESRIEGVHKHLRIHERKPFDGTDEDKAYLLGLSHGDFHVSRPFGDAVGVSTSSTHIAMCQLFDRLFSPYGHVYHHPRYKKDTKTYEWNFHVILDNSFAFLLGPRDKCRAWVARKDSTMLAYLAGLVDAEGHIDISPNPRTTATTLSIWNTDTGLLEFSYQCLAKLGHEPLEPYLHSPPGPILSGFRIERKKAYWRVLVARFHEAQALLRRLPLRHDEKTAIKELTLRVAQGDLYEWIADEESSLRKSFKRDARRFAMLAEREFARTHPVPTSQSSALSRERRGISG